METAIDTSQRFLTFWVDNQLYALRANQVSEVIRVPLVTRIPQGPPALLGLANLRGAVLPVASLRALLKKSSVANNEGERAIVLDIGAPIAVVVDAIENLATVNAEQIETHKREVSAEGAEKLSGAFAVNGNQNVADGDVAKVLDIKTMLESAFSSRTQPKTRAPIVSHHASQVVSVDSVAQQTQVIVSFEVAGQEFALPLEAVKEILPVPTSITAIARAESVVLGIVSNRDSLLPLLSLRTLLGFAPLATDEREKVIVMQVAGTQIGLVADRARAIVVAADEDMEPLPPILAVRSGGESRIKSIYRGDAGRRLISVLSPDQLFREDVMQRLFAGQQTQATRTPAEESRAQAELIFLVFRLGDDEFGLPIDTVVEVAEVPQQITRVPKTPKFLEGVVNLRGEVLPVVDQRRRFEMPKLTNTERRRLIVIKTERHRAGLIVDSVSDVLRTSAQSIEPPPALTDETSRLVRGVINLESAKRMVLLLDPTEVLTRAEQGLLDSFDAASKKASA